VVLGGGPVPGRIFAQAPTTVPSWAPISLHPANARYFLWRDRPTVLVTSGEHYGALLNLDFDYLRYFDALAADGLNLTRTFSGVYRELPDSFGITDNPLAPQPLQYICPWARSDQPGYKHGGNKFDLTQWDPAYFSRLRDFMQAAQERGIVVEMNLFCTLYTDPLWEACPLNSASNINGVGNCPREEVFTLKHDDLTKAQLALVRKMVSELEAFDNLYYEICNEPYFHGVTLAWQHRIADEIVDAEKKFDRKHLISRNVANGSALVEQPHPNISILNFHYCVPPDVVAANYHLNRAIGENETGFRGSDDLLYRTEGWAFLFAGGALYNNLDYSFTPAHPGGTFLDYKSPGGGSAALRKQLGALKLFFEGIDFVHTRPRADVVAGTSPPLTA
ncbi:MAG: cellulase family glycosylhydrolase, partial [Thermoguttaceae bacterium]